MHRISFLNTKSIDKNTAQFFTSGRKLFTTTIIFRIRIIIFTGLGLQRIRTSLRNALSNQVLGRRKLNRKNQRKILLRRGRRRLPRLVLWNRRRRRNRLRARQKATPVHGQRPRDGLRQRGWDGRPDVRLKDLLQVVPEVPRRDACQEQGPHGFKPFCNCPGRRCCPGSSRDRDWEATALRLGPSWRGRTLPDTGKS